MRPLHILQTLVLASLAAPAAMGNGVLISNFSAGVGTGTIFGSGAFTVYKAFGFTVDSAGATLESATLSMNFPNAGSMPVISIWSDGGGIPGSQLVALLNPGTLAGQGDFTFDAPGGSFALAPNTTYWLHVRSDPLDGPDFFWDGTSPSTMPSGTATAVGYIFNDNPSSFLNRLEITCVDGIGTSYCTAAPNSVSAQGSRISASGSTSISAADLTLNADNAPSEPAIFFFGSAQTNVPFGNGVRCVGGTTTRLPVIFGSGGNFTHSIDFGAHGSTLANLGTAFFQCWYRDPAGGGASFNLSDGLEVTFTP